MKGLSGPQDLGTWRLPRSFAAALTVVALFAILLLSPAPGELKRAISGAGIVCAGLLTAAGFRYRFRRAESRRRRSWACFAVAAIFATVGNLFLLLAGARADRGGSPSDLALMMCLVLGIAGMATYPLARRRGTDLARMILDGIVIGGSALFIANLSIFPRILEPVSSGGRFALLVPVTDVVVATVAVLLALRGASTDRAVLAFVAAGFCCNAASDFAYALVLGETGEFNFGTPVDLGWIAGYTLIALAVRNPGTVATAHGERPVEASPVLGTTLMFGLFLVAAVLSLLQLRQSTLSAPSAVLWLTVLLAVLARQIVLVIDNERLRRDLEQRVIDRSRSLRQMTVSLGPAAQLGGRRHLRRRPGRVGHLRQPGGGSDARFRRGRPDRIERPHHLPRPLPGWHRVPGRRLLHHRGHPRPARDQRRGGRLRPRRRRRHTGRGHGDTADRRRGDHRRRPWSSAT